jgi:hypothetical protein
MGLPGGGITRAAAIPLVATLLACGSAGNSVDTFDNTGGSPPPGTSIGFDVVPLTGLNVFSGAAVDCSALLPTLKSKSGILARNAPDVPVIGGSEACTTELRTALADAFATLTADQAIGIFVLESGVSPCFKAYEVAGVRRDGLVIRPWIYLLDPSLGARNGTCTTEMVRYWVALRFNGAAGATSMELFFGTINPNYPRQADVPMF